MIISKKKFDEAIKAAVENALTEEHRYMENENDRRYIEDRFENVRRRLDKAFNDIDRRLTELENTPSKAAYDSGVACNCLKY